MAPALERFRAARRRFRDVARVADARAVTQALLEQDTAAMSLALWVDAEDAAEADAADRFIVVTTVAP